MSPQLDCPARLWCWCRRRSLPPQPVPPAGTKIVLRLESASMTECEPDDCGMVSIRTLVPSITLSTAPVPSGEPAGLIAALEPV